MRIRSPANRWLLLAFVLLGGAPAWGLVAWDAARRARAVAAEQAALAERARLVASEQQAVVGRALLAADLLARLALLRDGDAAGCQDLLAAVSRAEPVAPSILVAGPGGDVRCASGRDGEAPRMAERLLLQRAAAGGRAVLGDYRLRNGVPLLTVAVPAQVPGAATSHVIAVVVALDPWTAAASRLGERGTALLVDGTGTVIARHPDAERWTGKGMADAPLVKAAIGPAAPPREIVDLDGVPRVHGIAPLAWEGVDGRAYVAVGAPAAAGGWAAAPLVALAALALVAAGALLVLFLRRPTDVPRETAEVFRAPYVSGVSNAEETLRSFSQQLLMAQEEERRRIARELHDEIGQVLASVKINLQALQRQPGAESFGRRLDGAVGSVDRAIQEVRSLSLQLRPPMLDELGLQAALRWYADRRAQEAGLDLTVDTPPGEGRLPPDVEAGCFRVAQEALTNVIRHARAHHVHIGLHEADGRVELVVRDDGVGFSVDGAARRAMAGECMGLSGMQERVGLLGGRLEVRSGGGQGTEVRASFPARRRPRVPVPASAVMHG